MAEITIDNVRKSFGALEVLHGVSARRAAGILGLTELLDRYPRQLPLLDSRPACKEGSCMDPTRLLQAPHSPQPQKACGRTH